MFMNREPFETGEYYHIYNRGTDKRIIFNDHIDVNRFLKSMDLFNSVEPIGSLWLLSLDGEQHRKSKKLVDGLGLPVTRVGSMFSFNIDKREFVDFFWKMLKRGIYFAPSAREANFVSTAHSFRDIAITVAAAGKDV